MRESVEKLNDMIDLEHFEWSDSEEDHLCQRGDHRGKDDDEISSDEISVDDAFNRYLAYANHHNYFCYAHELLRLSLNDGSLLLKLLNKLPMMYECLPKAYRDDLNLLLDVLKVDVNQIKYASHRLKRDLIVQIYVLNLDRGQNLKLRNFPELLLGTQSEIIHKLSIAKHLILDLTASFLVNQRFIHNLIMYDDFNLIYLPPKIIDQDIDFVKKILMQNESIYMNLSETLRDNIEIARIALYQNPYYIEYLGTHLKADESFLQEIFEIFHQDYAVCRYKSFFEKISKDMFHHATVFSTGLRLFGSHFIKSAPKKCFKDLTLIMAVLKAEPKHIQYFPRSVKNHPEVLQYLIGPHQKSIQCDQNESSL
jgi:hypothetical protein